MQCFKHLQYRSSSISFVTLGSRQSHPVADLWRLCCLGLDKGASSAVQWFEAQEITIWAAPFPPFDILGEKSGCQGEESKWLDFFFSKGAFKPLQASLSLLEQNNALISCFSSFASVMGIIRYK